MKTAISLPDRVFHEADRHARRVGKSRSELYAEALSEYLDRHTTDSVTEAMNEACAELGEVEVTASPFVREASRRLLKDESW